VTNLTKTMKYLNYVIIAIIALASISLAEPGDNTFIETIFHKLYVKERLYTDLIEPLPGYKVIDMESELNAPEITTEDFNATNLNVNNNLTVNGIINASQVGSFRQNLRADIFSQTYITTVDFCPQGQILISCSGGLSNVNSTKYLGSHVETNGACINYFENLNPPMQQVAYKNFICFNPNGN
jgi:hypothetical protein